jgi:dTMP kinase
MVFIVFEGSEGVGKTTQINLVAQKIGACVCTREPGGTPLGEEIRGLFKKYLANSASTQNFAITELLLMAAARNQHLEEIILPRLKKQEVVLCDRFLDSTYAYQGVLEGLEKSFIDDVHRPFLKNLVPDLTVILHTQPATTRERIRSRHQGQPAQNQQEQPLDRFDALVVNNEASGLDAAFERLYHEQWAYPAGKIPRRVLVDGEGSPEDVFARLWPLIDKAIHHEV